MLAALARTFSPMDRQGVAGPYGHLAYANLNPRVP